MKRLYWLIPAALLLTACDRKSAPDAFTPEMASFSNEFEFDPLRGPVKDFSQTLLDEHDVVVKKVSAQLSREGCFDLLTLEDVENKTGATLLLDANYYVDGRTHEKRLRLQGKCQLAEMPAAMTAMAIRWEKPPPPKRSDLPSPQRRQRIRVRNWTIPPSAPSTIARWARCVRPATTTITTIR